MNDIAMEFLAHEVIRARITAKDLRKRLASQDVMHEMASQVEHVLETLEECALRIINENNDRKDS